MSDDVWFDETEPATPAKPAWPRVPRWGWAVALVAVLGVALALGLTWRWWTLSGSGRQVAAVASATVQPTLARAPLATPDPLLADLRVVAARLEPEAVGACQQGPTRLGVRVWIENAGVAAAGSFVVSINGAAQLVPGLAPGDVLAIWQAGEAHEAVVEADVLGQVAETEKGNNRALFPLTMPTELAPCPPTPMPVAAQVQATATVAPTPTPVPSTALSPTAPACAGALPSQLRLGQVARVSRFPSLSLRLRRTPDLNSAILGLARPGEQIKIIDGPQCAGGMVWWKIIPASPQQMVMGWASEGDANGYWLVPDDGKDVLLPASNQVASAPTSVASAPTQTQGALTTVTPLAVNTSPAATAQPSATSTQASVGNQEGGGPWAFGMQNGGAQYLPNFANTAGCNWQGVAGQVLDGSGQPIRGYTVVLQGGGKRLQSVSGTATDYGPAGFELVLGNQPQTTIHTYVIQLTDPAGQPLSATLDLPTFAECDRNLALVTFVPAGP